MEREEEPRAPEQKGNGTEGKKEGKPYKNGGREGGGERSTILPSAFKKGVVWHRWDSNVF